VWGGLVSNPRVPTPKREMNISDMAHKNKTTFISKELSLNNIKSLEEIGVSCLKINHHERFQSIHLERAGYSKHSTSAMSTAKN
jgi:putative NIF3 family GTP cyclohydrolase 1 type 2